MYKLGKHRGGFVAVYVEGGKRKRRPLGTSDPNIAKNRLEQLIYGRAALTETTNRTIKDIFTTYLEDRRNHKTVALTRITYAWKSLEPAFGPLYPHHITDEKVQMWTLMRRKTVSNGTIHLELGYLRACLRWAERKGIISKAPSIELPSKPAPRVDYLTKDQLVKVLSFCRTPHISLFIVLAITTAARSNAILDLTWDRVDLQSRMITLSDPSQGATAKGRAVVPINDTLLRYLTDAKPGAVTPFVIEWAGQRVHSIKKALQSLSIRSAIAINAHKLRHSAAVWMAEGGVPMSEISQYLGHTNTAVTERVYARYSPGYLRKAARELDLP